MMKPFARMDNGELVYGFPVDEEGRSCVPFDKWDGFANRHFHAVGVTGSGKTVWEDEIDAYLPESEDDELDEILDEIFVEEEA